MANQPRRTQTERKADFRQLGGFFSLVFAAQHNDLVIADGGDNCPVMSMDRQAIIKARFRKRSAAFTQTSDGSFDLGVEFAPRRDRPAWPCARVGRADDWRTRRDPE